MKSNRPLPPEHISFWKLKKDMDELMLSAQSEIANEQKKQSGLSSLGRAKQTVYAAWHACTANFGALKTALESTEDDSKVMDHSFYLTLLPAHFKKEYDNLCRQELMRLQQNGGSYYQQSQQQPSYNQTTPQHPQQDLSYGSNNGDGSYLRLSSQQSASYGSPEAAYGSPPFDERQFFRKLVRETLRSNLTTFNDTFREERKKHPGHPWFEKVAAVFSALLSGFGAEVGLYALFPKAAAIATTAAAPPALLVAVPLVAAYAGYRLYNRFFKPTLSKIEAKHDELVMAASKLTIKP